MVLYLIRYSEIGLKSDPVRSRFEHKLASNIENMFIRNEAECRLTSDRGHLYVEAEDDHIASSIVSRSFGVVSFSPAEVIETDMTAICEFLAKMSKDRLRSGQSFAIRSRRTGDHSFTSRDVAIRAGDAVREADPDRGIKVDLDEPDVEFHIEVRWKKTYVYTSKVDGPGGLPYGSQGTVVAVIRDRDDALACWMMMKRGCKPIIVPIGPENGPQAEAISLLESWAPTGRLSKGPSFPELSEANLEVAIDFAWMKKANAMVLGNREDIFKKREFPLFYPLFGLSEEKLEDIDRKVGN